MTNTEKIRIQKDTIRKSDLTGLFSGRNVDQARTEVAHLRLQAIALSDIPERKRDLVKGSYEIDAPSGPTTVAVKIIDMLGEEVLVTAQV